MRVTSLCKNQLLCLALRIDLKKKKIIKNWWWMSCLIKMHLILKPLIIVEDSTSDDDVQLSGESTRTGRFVKMHRQTFHSSSFLFLHLVNNNKRGERKKPRHDWLFKVHPKMDYVFLPFMVQVRSAWSLDEMTIAFKGRSTLKVENHAPVFDVFVFVSLSLYLRNVRKFGSFQVWVGLGGNGKLICNLWTLSGL